MNISFETCSRSLSGWISTLPPPSSSSSSSERAAALSMTSTSALPLVTSSLNCQTLVSPPMAGICAAQFADDRGGEHADASHALGLLRTHQKGPRGRHAAEHRNAL